MGQAIRNWVAKIWATHLLAALISSPAQANGLTLPEDGADSLSLSVSRTTLEKTTEQDLLQIYVGTTDPCCEGRTPMAGRYVQTNQTLTFTPVFGFEAGQDYVARVRLPGKDERLTHFTIPSSAHQLQATVADIFPSGDTLPENSLRFYIHFSVPMQPHVAFDYIKLYDSSGNADDAAFMRFKQELWNADRTRLTILFDPGRIKREVATNVALGPALLAGQRYTLSVGGGWPTADGRSTLAPFVRDFLVTNALRERPDVELWHANSPCFGTRDPLEIQFDRPFDRHLLSKAVHVMTGDEQIIAGEIHIGAAEHSWRFIPNEPWGSKKVQVVANAILEDVAANNFVDLLDHVKSREADETPSTALQINLESCQTKQRN